MAQYLDLTGESGHTATTPDSAATSQTGDMAIAVKVAMDDWTPGVTGMFFSKLSAAGQRSYELGINATDFPFSRVSDDGTTLEGDTGDTVWGAADGTTLWVGIENDFGTGVRYFTSADGITWVQLGSTETLTAASIFDGTEIPTIGAKAGGVSSRIAGNFYEAKVYSSADLTSGVVVVHFNADDFTLGDSDTDTAVAVTGETWTINGANSEIKADPEGGANLMLLGVGS